jgi:hypothetical protein
MDQDRDKRIKARAYELWEENGRQDGGHEAHWHQAEREVGDEEAADRGETRVETPRAADRKAPRRKA